MRKRGLALALALLMSLTVAGARRAVPTWQLEAGQIHVAGLEPGEYGFAAEYSAEGRYLGAKVLTAETGAAALDEGTAYVKLLWTDGALIPQHSALRLATDLDLCYTYPLSVQLVLSAQVVNGALKAELLSLNGAVNTETVARLDGQAVADANETVGAFSATLPGLYLYRAQGAGGCALTSLDDVTGSGWGGGLPHPRRYPHHLRG